MFSSSYEITMGDDNPLDLIEELALTQEWIYKREENDVIKVEVKGQKNKYTMTVEWQEEFAALLFFCSMPIEIAEKNYEIGLRALDQINQNLWMGHFDLSSENKYPTWRYTLLSRLMMNGMTMEMLHDIFDIGIAECNRFYTTFMLVKAGDVGLQDNLQAAVYETLGEA